MSKLSIIIPCYNCIQTLREAVDSCYLQDLDEDTFEIIMVDDGSKDGTRELMQLLATEHDNIHLLYHEHNKGGGAARNTGINVAKGEIIYCLDSDNIFAPQSVKPMLEYLKETGVDGVAFYERRFFFGTNLKHYTTWINNVTDREVSLLDLFNETNTLLDNFFQTKEAYLRTGGYPEHHGFDTQCYEFRYLVAGNSIRVAPDSFFYHRQAMKERSYFERVHASGMFSVNYILMFEEFFYLFNKETQQAIIDFPIFSHTKSYGENLLDTVKKRTQTDKGIFITDYASHLRQNSTQLWFHGATPEQNTTLAHIFYHLHVNNDYNTAQSLFTTYIKETKKISPYLQFLSLRLLHGLTGLDKNLVVQTTLSNMNEIGVRPILSRGGNFGKLFRKSTILRYLRNKFR